MKSLILFLLLLLAFNPAPGRAQDFIQTDSLSGPRITFEQKAFDFGEVGSDSTLTYDFVFTNTGSDTLRIRGVKPG